MIFSFCLKKKSKAKNIVELASAYIKKKKNMEVKQKHQTIKAY